ncbi:hypothetical protein KAI04_01865 [Candidatus Pacearchaeota archaeon]|nr:hypothetical protein [Candidatus Pacearchaeota archaeon]
MRVLLDKSRAILELWSQEHNIREISNLINFTYDQVRNNYFKKFWKKGYLERVSFGKYVLSEKGRDRINSDLKILKSKEIILELSKNKFSNKQIKKELKKKIGLDLTDSTIFSQVSLLRKKNEIKHRRIKEIKIKEDKDFYEFLGLILSDGYIGKYNIDFYNKDPVLISYYENLMDSWNLKFSKRIKSSGTYEISVYSIRFVSLVNKFLNNKKKLSKDILNGKRDLKNRFLRGFYSGDGSVFLSFSYRKSQAKWRVEPRISLAVFNKPILDQTILILNSQGYNSTGDAQNIHLGKRKDIKKFFREIKFIEKGRISHSRYYKGFSKNDLLKYISTKFDKDKTLKKLMKKPEKELIVRHIRDKLRSV